MVRYIKPRYCKLSESVPVKNFENRSIIGKDMNKSIVTCFLWPTVYIPVVSTIATVVSWICVRNCSFEMSVSVVAKNTCQTTGEGPYWEEKTKCLVYVDITQNDVHRWNSITNEDCVLHLGLTCLIVVKAFIIISISGINGSYLLRWKMSDWIKCYRTTIQIMVDSLPCLASGVGRLLHLPSAEAVSVRPNARPQK